jgi:hypothetical protein
LILTLFAWIVWPSTIRPALNAPLVIGLRCSSWRGAAAGDTWSPRAPAGRNVHVDAHLMMPKRPRLTAAQRRALAILADTGPNGSAVAGMMAGGFKVVMIARLVRNGLVSASGGETNEVMQVHLR